MAEKTRNGIIIFIVFACSVAGMFFILKMIHDSAAGFHFQLP